MIRRKALFLGVGTVLHRRILNLSNATDRNGFIIKLGMSSWPF
jgi:hypothetical protein